ncbi:EVI2B protein, partial [Pitta sordida]|nr:EVI2B protein [Pitta sordida]
MGSKQVTLALFCGEMWKCFSAAAPQHVPMAESLALAVTPPQVLTGEEEEEAGDGSWIAALIIGSILVAMMVAVVVIVLWKCYVWPDPVVADPHWAGRSPFADGDTPDLLADSEQDTKRSSVLFMLPWKGKQGTNSQQDPTGSEDQSHHTTSTENGQVPVPGGDSGDSTAAPSTDPPPAPAPQTGNGNGAGDSCPHPDPPAEPHDLPPPPEWLKEPPEDASADPSERLASPSDGEEPLPPPPELLIQDMDQPLPQPEHPL